MGQERDLAKAAADLRRATKDLTKYADVLKRLEDVLSNLRTPAQRENQTTPAKRVTEQPVHTGQIPKTKAEKRKAEVGG